MTLQTPCKNCGDRLVPHRDGKCWVVPGVGAFCKCPGFEADYEAIAETKAEFDQQADELQGNLDEINRRWTAQRDELQALVCPDCPHQAHYARCFKQVLAGRTTCPCKARREQGVAEAEVLKR